MAAFLNQPIIPFGHHEDMADRIELVKEISAQINAMGAVKWCNLGDMARTNYEHRFASGTLQLRMYSRHIQARIPAHIDAVEVHRPMKGRGAAEPVQMRINGDKWVQFESGHIPLPAPRDEETRAIEIRSICLEPADYRRIPSQSIQPWGIVRRLLTEARDRCHGRGGGGQIPAERDADGY